MLNQYLEQHNKQNLRQIQLKELSILEEIVKICDSNDINYWLDGGTLLGAVRHGGFIPWDDDIDIAMTKEDADKFIKIAPSKLPPHLFLQTNKTDNIKYSIIKIRDLNSLLLEPTDDLSEDYQKGIFVDIFPFVDYPTISKKWIKKICRGICIANLNIAMKKNITFRNVTANLYFYFKEKFLKVIWTLLNLYISKDKYLGNQNPNNIYGKVHLKTSVFPLSEINFENHKFKCPLSPHDYLQDLYGDYMKIPPIENRKTHSVFVHPILT